MARALLVGGDERARALAERLRAGGWQVRCAAEDEGAVGRLVAAGIDAVRVDPQRLDEVLAQTGDVAVLGWLQGSADGDPARQEALHGELFEAMLRALVDTPVRGVVYEATGSVGDERLAGAGQIAERMGATWRIPVAAVDADPGDPDAWAARAEHTMLGVLRAS